jgi:hypothetical protein
MKKTLARSKAFATMQLTLKLFWVMTQHNVVGMDTTFWGIFLIPILKLDKNTNDTRLLV